MQGVFRRVRQIQLALSRRHESLLLQGVGPTLDAYKPVYERKPPWSARWTYPIIFAQIGVSCALTELIIHHWTELKTPEPTTDSAQVNGDAPPPKPEYVLRPWYQRAGAVLGQFCVGAFVCVLLLNSRARIVRKLYLIPSSAVTETALSPKLPPTSKHTPGQAASKAHNHNPNDDKILVMQNVYHFRGQGNVFPFSSTDLSAGYDSNELAFEVAGRRGKFYMGLQDASVNGEKMDNAWAAREALFKIWYGTKGKSEMSKYHWVK
ncbi:hypothetical protein BDY19DRAFT_1073734 [Irpex rosettiformis]|uniref:Uncharacterized protein n=1 Tax=Irpex rosettiformis TaxID=378272 RepID=A0ACB8TYB6_9APHY|nr:hypothetical protein BDY19DRAFT_1073734 [Irpex rosettiformis]